MAPELLFTVLEELPDVLLALVALVALEEVVLELGSGAVVPEPEAVSSEQAAINDADRAKPRAVDVSFTGDMGFLQASKVADGQPIPHTI